MAARTRATKAKAEPAAILASAFAAPEGLTLPARRHWARLVDALRSAGLLSEVDRDILTLYIGTWERRQEAEAAIRDEGMVIEGNNGIRQMNPHYKISMACQKEMRAMMASLAMTPAARAKVSGAKPERPSKLAEFLREMG